MGTSEAFSIALDEPLGDDDLAALADDIESAGKDFDWVTGFLTSILTGPELVPPSSWLTAVFGEDVFADFEEPRTKDGRVMRWYNEIASTIGGDKTICPLPSEHDKIVAFCDG